tara:strand:- start:1560 stop:1766 length:207 start_codon:yes stop_codon:yes gene_type:complete
MANHLDKFLDQIQRQGIAVSLVVAASFGGYHIMTKMNDDGVVVLKAHITEIKADKKLLFEELLECLKP